MDHRIVGLRAPSFQRFRFWIVPFVINPFRKIVPVKFRRKRGACFVVLVERLKQKFAAQDCHSLSAKMHAIICDADALYRRENLSGARRIPFAETVLPERAETAMRGCDGSSSMPLPGAKARDEIDSLAASVRLVTIMPRTPRVLSKEVRLHVCDSFSLSTSTR
jgi:hypothetical protein